MHNSVTKWPTSQLRAVTVCLNGSHMPIHPKEAPGFWSLWPLPYTLDTLHLPIKYHQSLKPAPPWHQPYMRASEKTETSSLFHSPFPLPPCVSSCYFKVTPVLLWSSLPAPGRLLLNHVLWDTPFTTLEKSLQKTHSVKALAHGPHFLLACLKDASNVCSGSKHVYTAFHTKRLLNPPTKQPGSKP